MKTLVALATCAILLTTIGCGPESEDDDLTRLHRALRKTTRAAIRKGGVHTCVVIPHRRPGGHCPRCGAAMERASVGGRTTWFCPREQT